MSTGVTGFMKEKRSFALCLFNRATYSRVKQLITQLSKTSNMELTVFLSSTLLMEEYGNAADYIRKQHENVRFVDVPLDHQGTSHLSSANTCAQITDRFSRCFSSDSFDAVIVVADRFETLGAAIAASYLNIPLIHIQGGEVTGNIDEKVRHSVTKLSDYHFAATELAKQYLIAMGEESYRVFSTGCPSLDVIAKAGIRRKKTKKPYIISQFHPDTNTPEVMYEQTRETLRAVTDFCRQKGIVCFWYWPNPDPGREEIIRLLSEEHDKYKGLLIKAVNKRPELFLEDLAQCSFIIGNSSCGIREASYLGVPAINVGTRQSIRERSWNVIDAAPTYEEVSEAIKTQSSVWKYKKSKLYGSGRSAEIMVEHLSRIEFSTKGPLTYPMQFRFKETHFGEERFGKHTKRQVHYHFKGPKPVGLDLRGEPGQSGPVVEKVSGEC